MRLAPGLFPALLAAAFTASCGERMPPATEPPAGGPATPAPASQPCRLGVLTESAVGDLRIGDDVAAIRARCGVVRDTTELRSEGQSTRVIAVALDSVAIEAEVVNDRVWRIEVLHPAVRTNDSLGVGTPVSRLLALRDPVAMSGEGRVFVRSPDHCGLSFQLGIRAGATRWDLAALKRLPPDTPVSRILVLGCEPAGTP